MLWILNATLVMCYLETPGVADFYIISGRVAYVHSTPPLHTHKEFPRCLPQNIGKWLHMRILNFRIRSMRHSLNDRLNTALKSHKQLFQVLVSGRN